MSEQAEDVEEVLGRREENRRLWLAQKALRWAADKISGDTPRGDRAEGDLRQSAEMLEPMIEDGWKAISDTAPGRMAAADDLRDLRERLEEAREERDAAQKSAEIRLEEREEMWRAANANLRAAHEARRQRDRLLEAVREVVDYFLPAVKDPSEGAVDLDEEKRRLSDALEGEGERDG